MTEEQLIKVMIVDDHDIAVVATAESAEEALERCGELGVEVVLMDLSMPGMDGATGTARLLERFPDVRVVVLTGFVDEASVRAAIQAGASACLLKTVGMDELADAIRGVTQGRSTFSSVFLPHLVGQPLTEAPGTSLTAREHDILSLLADGRTNRAIAQALGLSEGTVRVYVSTVLAKLGVTNRTEATVLAIRQGLVQKQS